MLVVPRGVTCDFDRFLESRDGVLLSDVFVLVVQIFAFLQRDSSESLSKRVSHISPPLRLRPVSECRVRGLRVEVEGAAPSVPRAGGPQVTPLMAVLIEIECRYRDSFHLPFPCTLYTL